MQSPHIPVLLDEVLSIFKGINDGIIVDCTLGYAGHSSAILSQNSGVNLIGCDKDKEAVEFSKAKLAKFKDRVRIYNTNFTSIIPKISQNNIRGILADIGVSSLQLDKNERGFSLKSDKLDMRMDIAQEKDAKFVLNTYSKDELARVFKEYGELTNANAIADEIIKFRTNKPLTSAVELVEILSHFRLKNRKISLATLAFQAIRIEVNNELGELEGLLKCIENSNINDAVVAIITFHSLEDRIVKNTFKRWQQSCICPPFAMKCECGNNHSIGKILIKTPLTASKDELKLNSRSASAKLRAFKICRQSV
ncbi:MAG: 16S rRNA (cytosine(1402)-N(4))-methyltransferase RsmH [Campylobacter sp.]|nr:16S rRNA (cytosine(1402)-N(4))-methyltransferase RsmH [Campylobacter sp.]